MGIAESIIGPTPPPMIEVSVGGLNLGLEEFKNNRHKGGDTMKRAACWSYLVIVALFAALIAAPVHGGNDGSQGLELAESQ